MTRFLLSTAAAALLLAGPMAASAPSAAATVRHGHMVRHTAGHMAGHGSARRMAPRDGGSAAVDALNDQALARARGTAQ